MKRTLLIALVGIFCVSVTQASAQVPDPEDFTPEGYKFCGWKDLSTGEWVMEWNEDLTGTFLRAFARGMTCRDARRNVTRVRYTQLPPYRPTRPGYRCVTLDDDFEYSDVRCTRIGAARKFRFQTGS